MLKNFRKKVCVISVTEISKSIKEGMTTEEIDKLAYDYTTSKGGIPADLNYDGFPKSICISINNEVCQRIWRTWSWVRYS